jgi:hypothetical protein
VAALLKSAKKADRIAAAEVLGQIGPEAAPAVPALMVLLKDRTTQECNVAARSLGRIGPGAKSAVPLLIDFLNDTEVRQFPFDRSLVPVFPSNFVCMPAEVAAEALGGIGPDAKAALPVLRAISNPRLRDNTVREAIRRIDSTGRETK